MPTLGRVKGWQGRMMHQGYKIAQLKQVDEVRVQRAFIIQAAAAGIQQDKITAGLDGMNEAIEAGLSHDAVVAIAWALARDDDEGLNKVIADNVQLTGEQRAELEALEDAELPADEAEKQADIPPANLPATKSEPVAEKPAKTAASATKQAAKKADKKPAKQAAIEPAKEPAAVASVETGGLTEADLAAVETENPYDDLGGIG